MSRLRIVADTDWGDGEREDAVERQTEKLTSAVLRHTVVTAFTGDVDPDLYEPGPRPHPPEEAMAHRRCPQLVQDLFR